MKLLNHYGHHVTLEGVVNNLLTQHHGEFTCRYEIKALDLSPEIEQDVLILSQWITSPEVLKDGCEPIHSVAFDVEQHSFDPSELASAIEIPSDRI